MPRRTPRRPFAGRMPEAQKLVRLTRAGRLAPPPFVLDDVLSALQPFADAWRSPAASPSASAPGGAPGSPAADAE